MDKLTLMARIAALEDGPISDKSIREFFRDMLPAIQDAAVIIGRLNDLEGWVIADKWLQRYGPPDERTKIARMWGLSE